VDDIDDSGPARKNDPLRMNKTLVIHGGWLLVSVTTFAVGRLMSPTKGGTGRKSSAVFVEEGSPAALKNGRSIENAAGKPLPVKIIGADGSLSKDSSLKSAVVAFLNERDPLKANRLFADLLLDLNGANAGEAFEALRDSRRDGFDFGQQIGLFLQAWGRIDGSAAVEAAGLDTDGRRRGFAMMSAVSGWAGVDAAAAKAWIAKLEDGPDKGMASQGLINGLVRTDPQAATQFVYAAEAEQNAKRGEARRDGPFRGFELDRQMESIANEQLRRGISEATQWAEGLPDGALKAAAFDRVASGYVRSDAAEAAKWVAGVADNEYAKRAVRQIAEEFSRTDPASALKWAAALPADSQAAAISKTLEEWTRKDALAASEYLAQMPESTTRDAAVGSFVRQLDREDPQSAATWAATISDPKLRMETLGSVARSWLRTNQTAANAWLGGLPEETKMQILTQPDRGFPFPPDRR
jgi:hypothetical protein